MPITDVDIQARRNYSLFVYSYDRNWYEVENSTLPDHVYSLIRSEMARVRSQHDYDHSLDDVRGNLIKSAVWDANKAIAEHQWHGNMNSVSYISLLGLMDQVICDCGITTHPLCWAMAYGGKPRSTAYNELMFMPIQEIGSPRWRELSRTLNCAVCAPTRYRMLASNNVYINSLRLLNPSHTIFGQRTCFCMACNGR